MSESEIIPLLVLFHFGGFRNLKHFYLFYVKQHLKQDFPNTVYRKKRTVCSGICETNCSLKQQIGKKHVGFGVCLGSGYIFSVQSVEIVFTMLS